MLNKQIIENNDLKKEEGRIWIGENKIINVDLAKKMTEEDTKQTLKEIEEAIKKVPGKVKISISLRTIPTNWSSQFRKSVTERIKEIAKNPGFEKAALFGGNLLLRTVASFIIVATGLKNVKIFSKKEAALEWLKK